FGTDIDTFVVPLNQFQETILVKIGAQRAKEVLHSLVHFFIASEVTFDSADFNAGKR
ncbi:hypothetical protein AVEN_36543-1, partial [Araneus ventricosus]